MLGNHRNTIPLLNVFNEGVAPDKIGIEREIRSEGGFGKRIIDNSIQTFVVARFQGCLDPSASCSVHIGIGRLTATIGISTEEQNFISGISLKQCKSSLAPSANLGLKAHFVIL